METVEFTLVPPPPGAGPFLADRLAALLTARPDAALVICDVSAVDRPGPADLDHLARLRLIARRAGRELLLRGAGPRLRLLLALTGLGEVLGETADGPSAPGSVGGQPHGESP
ncbi:hypothetical protein ACFC1R_23980 [Kitasatospora sp. NPDC056138]|uniref:hypothetical protein n=1 Tax=Kitasatospora sp. NPDC056138 TaxID=3345724 RepID=UPI0035E1C9EE